MGLIVPLIILGIFSAGSFVLGSIFTLKAVQLGQKWKMQGEAGLAPTTDAQDKPHFTGGEPIFTQSQAYEMMTGELFYKGDEKK